MARSSPARHADGGPPPFRFFPRRHPDAAPRVPLRQRLRWGAVLVVDIGGPIALYYGLRAAGLSVYLSLPVNAVPALNGAQYAVLFVLLQVATNLYYFRVGLFDLRSDLYRPQTT